MTPEQSWKHEVAKAFRKSRFSVRSAVIRGKIPVQRRIPVIRVYPRSALLTPKAPALRAGAPTPSRVACTGAGDSPLRPIETTTVF